MSDISPFDDETPSTKSAPTIFDGHRLKTLQAVGIVAAVCLLGNIFLPWVFWDSLPEWLFLAMFAFGGVAAQVALLSVWAGMGSDPLRTRLLYTGILICVVCGSYIIGLQVPDFPNSGMPVFLAYIIFGGGVASWVMGAVAFLAIATATRTRIAHPSASKEQQQDNRLSIAYVIGITTAVAFAFALVPKIMPDRQESLPQNEWVMITLMGLQHTMFSMACLLVSAWAMLSPRRNTLYFVALGALLPLSILANVWLLGNYRTVTVDAELVSAVAGFTLGFVVFVNAMLGIVRWLGYRILPAEA